MSLTNLANLELPLGSAESWAFAFNLPGGAGPYNITGLTWEFRVRPNTRDTASPPLIEVTQTANSQGVITVNTATSVVTVSLYPAATTALGEGLYAYALWANPGTTTAQQWVGGNFQVDAVVQP